MSEEKKDLGDKAEEAFDKAKDAAKDAAGDAKEAASEFAEGAKETAKEFSEGVKDTLNTDNKKILAGILAIVLGGFGIHKFILGYTKEGIIMLVATVILGVITCGIAGWVVWVIGLIEGIIYLTKSDEEFYNTYQVGKKPWF
ncbi:MAG: TM2 domain-containing protein [Flavobacteriaceae bacterium]|uniref:TM2 domain-containing protein n=1 Tax=Flagellimonas algarum TaxID=3230298 RepID=UPI003393F864|nr:TM2 domain-containing protein [Flavobacteriaceae bacterium]